MWNSITNSAYGRFFDTGILPVYRAPPRPFFRASPPLVNSAHKSFWITEK